MRLFLGFYSLLCEYAIGYFFEAMDSRLRMSFPVERNFHFSIRM